MALILKLVVQGILLFLSRRKICLFLFFEQMSQVANTACTRYPFCVSSGSKALPSTPVAPTTKIFMHLPHFLSSSLLRPGLRFAPPLLELPGETSFPHPGCAPGQEEDRDGVEDLQANREQGSQQEEEEHPIDQAFACAAREA